MREKILITGAAGFIGYNLAKQMLSLGYDVIALDNLSRGDKNKFESLRKKGAETHIVDIRDMDKLREIIGKRKPNNIVHLAALISVEESFLMPENYFDVNVLGTLRLLKVADENNVERIVYISSAAVYGNPVLLPIKEEHPTLPLSPYGLSKLAGEHLTRIYASKYEMDYIILRLFNVYGPGQNPLNPYSGVISKFVYNALIGKELVIFGDGTQSRDFVHVNDIVSAIQLSLETENTNTIYNIGSGRRVTINELAKKIIDFVGKGKTVYASPREGDIKHSYADISKAEDMLGFTPKIDIDKGIKELIEVVRKEKLLGN